MFLLVILCLAVVHAQTFPYVSFLGDIIPNHGYVDLIEVGSNDDSSDSVQCITDLSTCCSNTEGDHRGDWYFPDGTRLGFTGDIFEGRGPQRVVLRRINNANSPVGIYRCDIQTEAVHHETNTSVRDTLYVGLYNASEGMFYSFTKNVATDQVNITQDISQ